MGKKRPQPDYIEIIRKYTCIDLGIIMRCLKGIDVKFTGAKVNFILVKVAAKYISLGKQLTKNMITRPNPQPKSSISIGLLDSVRLSHIAISRSFTTL